MRKSKTIAEKAMTQNHIFGIGLVAAEWGYVEYEMEELTWLLLGSGIGIGACVTTHLSSTIRNDILRSLADQRSLCSNDLAELVEIIKEHGRLRIERNNIIHSFWAFTGRDPASNEVAANSATARGELKLNHRKVTSDEIVKIAETITELHGRISQFQDRIRASLDPK